MNLHCMSAHSSSTNHFQWCSVLGGSGVEGVASYSHCIQNDRHVMWSMLTGNEVACSCLHMHSAVDVCTSKGMLGTTIFLCNRVA